MKIRKFSEFNYKAIFLNGKTLRIPLNPNLLLGDLEYPEFMDIKITDKCNGCCSYCYQNSLPNGDDYGDVVEKIKIYFSKMDDNQKPFQVALGGGNPNEHPQFIEVLEYLDSIGIMPNYTTNGMGVTNEIIEATKRYCGGVAISCHKHLDEYWMSSFNRFKEAGIKTNLHLIISDKNSIDRFIEITKSFEADYYVLLPLTAQGRCITAQVDYEYLISKINDMDIEKVAFGAMFYPYIKNDDRLNISLYEPEILSKYLDLKDNGYLYGSSFSNEIIKSNLF